MLSYYGVICCCCLLMYSCSVVLDCRLMVIFYDVVFCCSCLSKHYVRCVVKVCCGGVL